MHSTMESQSLDHWTAREAPREHHINATVFSVLMIHTLSSFLFCLIIFPSYLSPFDIFIFFRQSQLTCGLHVGRVLFSLSLSLFFVHCVLPGLKIVDGTEQAFSKYMSKE